MYWHILQSGQRCPGHEIHLCTYRFVDPCPEDYRVQASRFSDRLESFDGHTCDPLDAEAIKAKLESQGWECVSVMAPRCTGKEEGASQ